MLPQETGRHWHWQTSPHLSMVAWKQPCLVGVTVTVSVRGLPRLQSWSESRLWVSFRATCANAACPFQMPAPHRAPEGCRHRNHRCICLITPLNLIAGSACQVAVALIGLISQMQPQAAACNALGRFGKGTLKVSAGQALSEFTLRCTTSS